MTPEGLRYSKEHEWVAVQDGGEALIGITFYAQKELGDIVFVELPEEGETVEAGHGFAVVESVKAVSDIYAPVSGTIVAVNRTLEERPGLINEDPYGEDWIVRVRMSKPAELDALMDAQGYADLTAGA